MRSCGRGTRFMIRCLKIPPWSKSKWKKKKKRQRRQEWSDVCFL